MKARVARAAGERELRGAAEADPEPGRPGGERKPRARPHRRAQSAHASVRSYGSKSIW